MEDNSNDKDTIRLHVFSVVLDTMKLAYFRQDISDEHYGLCQASDGMIFILGDRIVSTRRRLWERESPGGDDPVIQT